MASANISPHDLDDVGRRIAFGAQRVRAPATDLTAPANDPVSVRAAHAVQQRIAQIGAHTLSVNADTHAAGDLTQHSAKAYASREAANTRMLTLDDSGGPTTPSAEAGLGRTPAVLPAPTAAPPAGSVPTRGRDIADLVHRGPGEASLVAAADRLTRHADELSDAAAQLQSDNTARAAAWQSGAAD
jgi:hypothetical protein